MANESYFSKISSYFHTAKSVYDKVTGASGYVNALLGGGTLGFIFWRFPQMLMSFPVINAIPKRLLLRSVHNFSGKLVAAEFGEGIEMKVYHAPGWFIWTRIFGKNYSDKPCLKLRLAGLQHPNMGAQDYINKKLMNRTVRFDIIAMTSEQAEVAMRQKRWRKTIDVNSEILARGWAEIAPIPTEGFIPVNPYAVSHMQRVLQAVQKTSKKQGTTM